MHYDALRVKIRVRAPMLLSHPWIHFDSILSHLHREKVDDQFYNLPSKQVVKSTYAVQEKRWIAHIYGDANGELPFPLASVYIFHHVRGATLYKRFETAHLEKLDVRKKFIDIASGHLRNWALNFVLAYDPELEFRVLTDREWLEDLLQNLTHIGKKRVAGYGEVRSITIESLSSAWDVLFDEQGRTTRQLPRWAVESPDDDWLYWGTASAPYWDKSRQVVCVRPEVVVQLTESVHSQMVLWNERTRHRTVSGQGQHTRI